MDKYIYLGHEFFFLDQKTRNENSDKKNPIALECEKCHIAAWYYPDENLFAVNDIEFTKTIYLDGYGYHKLIMNCNDIIIKRILE